MGAKKLKIVKLFKRKKKKYYALIVTFDPKVGIKDLHAYWWEMEKADLSFPGSYQMEERALWGDGPGYYFRGVAELSVDKKLNLTEDELFGRIRMWSRGNNSLSLHSPKGW